MRLKLRCFVSGANLIILVDVISGFCFFKVKRFCIRGIWVGLDNKKREELSQRSKGTE